MACTPEDFEKVTKIVLKKACDDENFESLCFSDREAALKELEDQDIPEEMKLTFVRNLGMFVNLPEADELVIEIGDKDCCRYKFMDKSVVRTHFIADQIDDEYDMNELAGEED